MKELLRRLLVIAVCISSAHFIKAQKYEYLWEQKANYGGGKAEGGCAFTAKGKGYVCFSYSGKDIWRYNPLNDSWKKVGDFPGTPRKDAVGFTVGGRYFIGMGIAMSASSNEDLKDIWEYDPIEDHWEQKGDFPGGARHGAIGFTIGNTAYVALGGQSGRANNYNDLWAYDAKNDKWSRQADFPETGRSDAGVFVLNKDAYVLFGEVGIKLIESKHYVYKYSQDKNTWTKDADFPGQPRAGACLFSIKDKGCVFGGYNGGNQRYGDFWEYDPATKAWKEEKPDSIAQARNNAFCFVIDSAAYLGTGKVKGGLLSPSSSDFWRISTRTNVDFKAKLIYKANDKRAPLAQQGVSLVSQKKVLQTTVTDSTGSFGFKKLDVDGKYSLVLDKNDKLPANAVVSIAKSSGKIVMNLAKNNDGKFAYEVSKLDLLDEDDSYFNLQYFMKSTDKEVTITSHINYANSAFDLTDEAKDILYQVIVSLNQYPNLTLEISSHTDAIGTPEENMNLSNKRAKVVVDYLVSNGIDAKRITGKGYGDTMILNRCKHGVDCSDEENAVNRRTEFKFIKP